MNARVRAVAGALLVFACASCAPHAANDDPEVTPPAHGVRVSDAWARPTPQGASAGAGYMTLASAAPETLLGASVADTVAAALQMHTITRDSLGAMSMHETFAVPISPTNPARFAPGAMHLMFVGLRRPLTEGDTLSVTLRFAHTPEQRVTMPVRVPQ